MRALGFKWAKEEYEWLRERLTDYNIGWVSGYAERRASFLRNPENHMGEIQLYLDESWIYDGESSRYAWATSGKAAIQEKCHYRRWGIIGCLGCEWDLVGEEEYLRNHPPREKRETQLEKVEDGGLLPSALFQST